MALALEMVASWLKQKGLPIGLQPSLYVVLDKRTPVDEISAKGIKSIFSL